MMDWIERGGPPVQSPERRGFGTTVVESMAKRAVGGEVELDFAFSRLEWLLPGGECTRVEGDDGRPRNVGACRRSRTLIKPRACQNEVERAAPGWLFGQGHWPTEVAAFEANLSGKPLQALEPHSLLRQHPLHRDVDRLCQDRMRVYKSDSFLAALVDAAICPRVYLG